MYWTAKSILDESTLLYTKVKVGRGGHVHIALVHDHDKTKPYFSSAMCGAGQNTVGSRRPSAVRPLDAEPTCSRCIARAEKRGFTPTDVSD